MVTEVVVVPPDVAENVGFPVEVVDSVTGTGAVAGTRFP
jgi:hypothetical protein